MDAPQTAAQGRAPEVIAGRIDAAPSALMEAVEAWLAALTAKKRKPRSVKSYGSVVKHAIAQEGWRTLADLTGANILDYLDGQMRPGTWEKGATYNRALSSFRSLVRHLRQRRLLTENPLEFADRAEDDSDQKIRAATVGEARALIRCACAKERADHRGGGQRALYWLCLFAPGCRPGEPEQWKRRNVQLDAEIPYFHWTKDIQKNKKEEDCAIPPELVPLLRAQREEMRALAKINPTVIIRNRRAGTFTLRKIDPADPLAFVFAHAPCKSTFNKDRDDAKITRHDSRGLSMTPRSARRYFKTTAIATGIHGDLIRFWQRHKRLADEVYHDLTLASQARELARMPLLWPSDGLGVENLGIPPFQVDNPESRCSTPTATMTHSLSNSAKTPGHEGLGASSSLLNPQGAWPGVFSELVQRADQSRKGGFKAESPQNAQCDPGLFGLARGCGIQPVIRFLEALVGLLQAGAGHDEPR